MRLRWKRPSLRTCLLLSAWLSGTAALPRGSEESGTEEPGPEVHVYYARTAGWKGIFATHSWLAFRESGTDPFQIVEVMGFDWQIERSGSYIRVQQREPTQRYRGGKPVLLQRLTGDHARSAIPRIRSALEEYPYAREYALYPGPNSNTFLAWMIRRIPELTVELPPTAIGKDWLVDHPLWDGTESGTGAQLSLFGVLGLTVGAAEGLEVNVLGLTFGVDVLSPALKLPLLGRVGVPDRPLFWR